MTDKLILSQACKVVSLALLVAIVGIMLAKSIFRDSNILVPSLPGVLSAIGVLLTFHLRKRIDVAVAIYLTRHGPVSPAFC